MKAEDLRTKFVDFFVGKTHKLLPPASLIPENDPSVLLTTAGMQQFKGYYINPEQAPAKNIVTVQPCFRTSDIDLVGDNTHLTFFEMLGNFSFGGYFKEKAIKMAYEFLTDVLNIEPKRIKCSIFKGDKLNPRDKESAEILEKMGLEYEEFSRKENFWGPTGDEGPCGPTVEFYIDDIEVWNLVFNEYYKEKDGSYRKLETPGVDTGMGLERMLVVINGLKDVYETDVFVPIIKKIEEISGKKYSENQKSFRIIADNMKAAAFLINEGILPLGRDELGSVTQRLIRKAISAARSIGITTNCSEKIAKIIFSIYSEKSFEKEKTIEILKETETQIISAKEAIEKEKREEEKILRENYSLSHCTIEEIKKSNARRQIKEIIWHPWFFLATSLDMLEPGLLDLENRGGGKITLMKNLAGLLAYRGDAMFGNFKPDLKNNLIDIENLALKERRTLEVQNFPLRVKLSVPFKEKIEQTIPMVACLVGEFLFDLKQEKGADEYDFYAMFEELGLSRRNPRVEESIMRSFNASLKKHQELSRTASAGMFRGGLAGESEITTRMHTATHLLLKALQEVLGGEVHQKGSNITSERIRFDFSYPDKMTEDQIKKVENIVNGKIKEDLPVLKKETTVEEAKKIGAEAQFISKYQQYGGKLTLYSIGDYSHELCGGPHVNSTDEIGKFKIIKEESSSAGVRRIRAILE